jgi:hypothetical protein
MRSVLLVIVLVVCLFVGCAAQQRGAADQFRSFPSVVAALHNEGINPLVEWFDIDDGSEEKPEIKEKKLGRSSSERR